MLQLLGDPPFCTLAIAVICLLLFIPNIARTSTFAVCLLPTRVFSSAQVYRIFTYPFFHAGFFHILFNLIAWFMLANNFEKTVGTLGAFYVIFVLFIPLSALLQCAVSFIIDALASTQFRNDCAVGISGVLFAILVVNIHVSATSSISFFGLFNISANWYPWVLAVILQLLSPRLSFMGHISGILMGYALVLGYLRVITPSDEALHSVEDKLGLRTWPLWQSNPSIVDLTYATRSFLPQATSSSSNNRSFMQSVRDAGSRFLSWLTPSSASSSSTQPFASRGQTLGGNTQSPATGRVPSHSRLLRPPEPKPTNSDTSGKQSSQDSSEQHVSEGGVAVTEKQPTDTS
ncbi:Rhomboid-like protein 15 [Gracilariopsis chorda]|uniref:Rhomboid-like protein 15 n=1 Tax=Gracilariopsis chorda TaxID=448386 RepID=A0A2V3J1D6_9FLOR|nr:Rhomboid-like protein 15 [Gracilariopsis chorda]|eukprot:PXF48184.1 Rhomboid-like protein 15 [Gracilariopsis chorda]